MVISDWSSDVCSSDLNVVFDPASRLFAPFQSGEADVRIDRQRANALFSTYLGYLRWQDDDVLDDEQQRLGEEFEQVMDQYRPRAPDRSEEHTSELQSLMRSSYAVLCLKKKQTTHKQKKVKPPRDNSRI